MRNKILFMSMLLLLQGCGGMLPGMQNLDTETIAKQEDNTPPWFKPKPVVIPITAWFLMKNPQSPYQYHLAAEDILSITVWKHPELNIYDQVTYPALPNQTANMPGYVVNPDGTIYFPLVGTIPVAGKTVPQARALISKRLRYYLRDPHVMVRIVDFRSQGVYVMGEVLKPGFFSLNDQPLTITAALNLAGSFDPNAADPRHVYVIRGSIVRPKIYWLNVSSPTALLLGERFQLQNHDIVIVSTAVVTRWNRFLNQLLPTLQSVWYTKAITEN